MCNATNKYQYKYICIINSIKYEMIDRLINMYVNLLIWIKIFKKCIYLNNSNHS